MRICFLSRADSIHTTRLVGWLEDRGHDIHLLSFEPYEGNKEIHYYQLYRPSFHMKKVSFMMDPILAVPQARKLLRRIKPDLVHAHYLTNYGFIGAMTKCSPLICNAWGSDILSPHSKSAPLAPIMRFILSRSDCVGTISNYMKEYIVDAFNVRKERIVTVPWGIDLKLYRPNSKREREITRRELRLTGNDFVIISPRTLKRFYGQENIVRSLPLILRKHPNAFLILLTGYGKNEKMTRELEKLAMELGVERNLRIINQILSSTEMISLYNISDIMISIPEWDEFSRSILECMALGVVPVVGELKSYQTYLEHNRNALFVNRDDPRDIAEKVVYYIEHPDLIKVFAGINLEIVKEKENQDTNLVKLERLYMKVIQKAVSTGRSVPHKGERSR